MQLKKIKMLFLIKVNNSGLNNIDVVSDENIKSQILSNSIFAVSKSGTVSLQICKFKCSINNNI